MSGGNARNIFSAHPPFNFIVKYGTQEGSVTTTGRNKGTGSEDNFTTFDRIMATDFNERLVQKTSSDSMDIVLQSIQLLSMGTGIAPGGQALVETYQFLARDMYISDGGIRKNVRASETTASDSSSGAAKTNSNTSSQAPTPEEVAANIDFSGINFDGLGTLN